MKAWIISVCGIALLTILCDVIVPDGNTKKYVRTVIGVVLSFAILMPITRLFESFPTYNLQPGSDLFVQQQFIEGLSSQNDLARLQKFRGVTESLGLKSCTVTLHSDGYVFVRVCCDKVTLMQLQSAVSSIENKIVIAWSNVDG